MKKIIIILLATLSFNQITAQENLKEITNKVMNLRPSENILKAFGSDLSKYQKSNNDMVFNKHFTVSNEKELLAMFSSIANARKNGIVAQNIWDNFGIGKINTDNLVDGRINTDNFIGELPGRNRENVGDIGLGIGHKKNRPGSRIGNKNNDLMNPGGGIKSGDDYDPTRNGSGNNSYGDNTGWNVNATNSNYQHSDANGYSSFTHHHSEVSNDNGYSSTTDMQTNKNSDGSSTTRIVVSQTQPDGSNATSVTTTTKDSEGNSHTTQTVTKKNSDGEVTSQKTTEKNNPPKDGDAYIPEEPEGYFNSKIPPSNEEKESAVWRAVAEKGFNSGGNRGEHKTETGGTLSQNPELIQNKQGYIKPKTRGGKVNKNIKKTKLIHTIEH